MKRARLLSLGLATVLVVASCGDTSPAPGDPAGPEPDQPPDGVGLVVDWSDPAKVLELDDGWTIHACEGDAPLLCVEREGTHVGVVEVGSYPIESLSVLDPTADSDINLVALANFFLEANRADRVAGCGADYGYQPIGPEPFFLANTPGMAYGFVGTTSSGGSSELILRYMTIVGDQVISIGADAYDDGGCLGRDDLSGFYSDDLFEFRPHLELVLHASPLPRLDG